MQKINRLTINLTLIASTLLASIASYAVEEVNLYSARKEKLIKPLLDTFTKNTDIKVNLITAKLCHNHANSW